MVLLNHITNVIKAERAVRLMVIICIKVINTTSTVDYITDAMMINFLGKDLANWATTLFIMSWLNCNHRLTMHV